MLPKCHTVLWWERITLMAFPCSSYHLLCFLWNTCASYSPGQQPQTGKLSGNLSFLLYCLETADSSVVQPNSDPYCSARVWKGLWDSLISITWVAGVGFSFPAFVVPAHLRRGKTYWPQWHEWHCCFARALTLCHWEVGFGWTVPQQLPVATAL